MRLLRLAVGFLTVFPQNIEGELPPQAFGQSGAWYPFVGALIAAVVVGLHTLLQPILPPLVTAACCLIAWEALSGGLHLDGLADCCDGLLAPVSPERRLEILKDPRLGSFGGSGLTLHLILKFSLLSALFAGGHVLLPLLFAAAAARWCILWVAQQPAARPGGMGATFQVGLTRRIMVLAALLPMGLAALNGLRGAAAVAAALFTTAAVIRFARARLGGMTGDLLGLTVELVETISLLPFIVHLPF